MMHLPLIEDLINDNDVMMKKANQHIPTSQNPTVVGF